MFFRFQAEGQEHIPQQGGVLIAANHASYLDIPFLGCGVRRRVAFLGRQDLFKITGLNTIVRWLGWIPIRQDRLDRRGFSRAIELIQDGNVVVLYPEGTRTPNGELKPGKPGIGVLVAEAGCSVVPAYLKGTREALPLGASWPRFHQVIVRFGPPIDFSAACAKQSRKEFYRFVSWTVMNRIAELGQVAKPEESSRRVRRAVEPDR